MSALASVRDVPGRLRTWTPMHIHGYHCDRLEFDLDHGEHQRRQACGLGPVPNFRALETLMNLPGGHRIDYRSLSEMWRGEIRWLEATYPGTMHIERTGRNRTGVTALLTPPAQDCLALIYGKRFALGHMNRAARFAPMGRRAVVYNLAQAEKADPFAAAQHGYYGVGLGAHDGDAEGGVRWLLEPAPYRPMRFTAAAWWFAETIYGEWLTTTGNGAAP